MFKEEILKGKYGVYINSKEEAKNFISYIYINSDKSLHRYKIKDKLYIKYIGQVISINTEFGNCFECCNKSYWEKKGYNILTYQEALKESKIIQAPNSDIKFLKPDFDCELLKIVDGFIIGYVMTFSGVYPSAWNKDGYCYLGCDESKFKNDIKCAYNLTPYTKKEWYEDTDNLNKLIYCLELDRMFFFTRYKNNKIYVNNTLDHFSINDVRLATNEEIDSLKIN